jgi:outer membrane lipoprotein carrier protein
MEMVDGFGQTTRLYFDPMVRNPQLDKEIFDFTPPPGVDVIGEALE